jgi:hypothetical protein
LNQVSGDWDFLLTDSQIWGKSCHSHISTNILSYWVKDEAEPEDDSWMSDGLTYVQEVLAPLLS